ncbi:hypothetical protein GE278_20465 [Enterobacteriaceae bacterium Kacie_13]|nr:hypothetical protein GE278_20465 [Enterobacteriaceae bacterium Kacie_13]
MKRQSKLSKPVQYWDEDLPKLVEDQKTLPQLIRVNEINDVWMEIPRYVNYGWGAQWFGASISLFSFGFILILFVKTDMFSDLLFCIFNSLILFSFFTLVMRFVRSVLFEPRGAPVRFNRKRQKVYVYEYQKKIWPWKRWPVVIKVFDWADIQGERVQMAGHADWGHRVYCAVCKPGTYEVIDRFILTWTVGNLHDAYGLWSHCCHYMEKKPVPTAPLETEKPRSWTPFQTIHWPEAIDRGSTTAPE